MIPAQIHLTLRRAGDVPRMRPRRFQACDPFSLFGAGKGDIHADEPLDDIHVDFDIGIQPYPISTFAFLRRLPRPTRKRT